MKTETAIEYAKRVYPDVSEITQLQIANAYLSGATEGMRLATEKFKGADIMDEDVEDEAYNKASSNAGTLI